MRLRILRAIKIRVWYAFDGVQFQGAPLELFITKTTLCEHDELRQPYMTAAERVAVSTALHQREALGILPCARQSSDYEMRGFMTA